MEKKIGFIGVGNMASAIIGGIAGNTVAEENIIIFDTNAAQYEKFDGKAFVRVGKLCDAVRFSDIIILAVKPQNYRTVLNEIKENITDFSGKIFVSIAAGIKTDMICSILGESVGVIRTMPNTPLLVGEGTTAVCKNKNINAEDFEYVKSIFASRGYVSELSECDMNKIISATSSSPAYVFLFIKALCDGAAAQGLCLPDMKEMVCNALIGSAKLALASDKTLDELIKMVTSPKGTTEKALEVLYANNFEKTVSDAMLACTKRADELSDAM